MPVLTGRIFEILHINDICTQIVVRKKDRGKTELWSITLYGWWKDKAMEQDLRQKDKIKVSYRVRSKEFDGKYGRKYYDECVGRQVYVVEKAPYRLDKSTGELF